MNQEAIKLLKKHLAMQLVQQVIALLEQQPQPSEFTGGARAWVKNVRPLLNHKCSPFDTCESFLLKACDLLDRQEAKPITENPDVQRLIVQVVQLQVELDEIKSERTKSDYWVNYHNMAIAVEQYQSQIKQLQAENEKLKEIEKQAKNLFDNRLGWSNNRNPDAPPEFWDRLAQALDPVQKAAEQLMRTGSVEDLKAYNEARQNND